LFNVIAGDISPTEGRVLIKSIDCTTLPSRLRPQLGVARTYQKTRLLTGLTVEDNLYLAILGVSGGHLRPVVTRRDAAMRERAAELAGTIGLAGRERSLVGSLSHGEQRQLEIGMARASDPILMMLDEPASGLSRGERVALTELLLSLDPNITLILIEHDMDVALRVAQRVTMMHEGKVIVEGTPDEIRANQTVHDLYLGRGYGADG
jgi:branched-chain amino acid transport system ATP-binding protein